MPSLNDEQLDRIGRASEIEVAPRRSDGSLRPYTRIWVIRVGDELFVRSWNGPNGSWYRSATKSGNGSLRISGDTHDVSFLPADDIDRATIDGAYRDKYGRSSYVDGMVADAAAATTLHLVPR